MEAMTETKLPLSVLAAPVRIYPQLLKNVIVTDKNEAMNHPAVAAVFYCARAVRSPSCA